MKDIWALLRLTWTQKRYLVLSFACSIFTAVFTSLFVNLVQPIIDDLFLRAPATAGPARRLLIDALLRALHVRPEDLTRVLPLLLVGVFLGKGLFTFLADFFMKNVGHRVVKTLRDDLYGHLVRQSAVYFDRVPTGDLLSRLTNDVEKIKEALSGSLGDLIEEAFIIVGLLVTIFILDVRLALVSLVVAPLAAVPLALFSRQLKKKSLLAQEKMSAIYGQIHEMAAGHKVVKAFGSEDFERRKFARATGSYLRTSLKLSWVGALSSPFMELLGGIVGAFILWVGTQRIDKGVISPGVFGAFLMGLFSMYMPIKRLSKANNVIQQAVACLGRVDEVLKAEPQVRDLPGAVALGPVRGHVRFEGVRFAYDGGRPVLDDVSFEAQPSETLALVGLSGAGKTTIISLLSRFYDPVGGRVVVDGMDIREATLASLRSRMGLVTQETILFNDTVRANIAYGLEDCPMDRVVRAAKAAKAHDFIVELPHGYDTPVGEKGGLLSAGQRQRLAIARALLKDPPILILDEATSSLDAESEHLVQEALANLRRGRTTIVIAHRLSTIRSADRILVVDRGRIAEAGRHEELLRRDGLYRKLYELQFPDEEEGRA